MKLNDNDVLSRAMVVRRECQRVETVLAGQVLRDVQRCVLDESGRPSGLPDSPRFVCQGENRTIREGGVCRNRSGDQVERIDPLAEDGVGSTLSQSPSTLA